MWDTAAMKIRLFHCQCIYAIIENTFLKGEGWGVDRSYPKIVIYTDYLVK